MIVGKLTGITFNNEEPNIGGDMNSASGTFTTRIPGHYFLTFSAQTRNGNAEDKPDMCVRVLKNGGGAYSSGLYDFLIYDGNDSTDENNLSYSWIQRLQIGDKISFKTCTQTTLFASGSERITFAGHLLLADE